MMLSKKLKILMSFLLFSSVDCTARPKLTIVLIVDQFAYHYLYKLKPFLKGGIGFLLNSGVSYENAHYPHALPETAVGHTALNTGTYPKDHGIIANSWYDKNNKEIECDADPDLATAGVFAKKGIYEQGRSAKHIMVDGISDQYAMASTENKPRLAYALSLKSRAAIGCSTKLGKAIWFDKLAGQFTTSKAYFDDLPDFIAQFNTEHDLSQLKSIPWPLAYRRKSSAYRFKKIAHYEYAQQESWAGKKIPLFKDPKDPYLPVYMTPFGDTYLLDFAWHTIQSLLTDKNELLLWVSLSCLDYAGHRYGPDSLEAIDIIYHLDKELTGFIQKVQNYAGAENVLFALTADHGVLPSQGILQERGITTAYKLLYKDMIKEMNALLAKKYGINEFVTAFQTPCFYFDKKQIGSINKETLERMIIDLKQYLRRTPGIKNVWTVQELHDLPVDPKQQELEYYFKMQLYPGRSGDLIVQLQPYTLLTKYVTGTSHESPYNYDTHVPLVLYQQGKFEHKSITQKVFMTQFANTLAQVLDVAKPSASTFNILPDLL